MRPSSALGTSVALVSPAFPPGLQLGHTSSEALFFVRISLWPGWERDQPAPSPPLRLPTPQKRISAPLELKAGAVRLPSLLAIRPQDAALRISP